MGEKEGSFYKSDEEREAALQADRETAEAPLPGANYRKYPNEGARQADLAAAERANKAKAAGERGLTVEEWEAKRKAGEL